MSKVVTHWIDGRPRTDDGETADIVSPDTGEVVRRVALADDKVVDAAVDAARRASAKWAAEPLPRRVAAMDTFADLVAERSETLVDVICEEGGKVRADASAEIQRTNDLLKVVRSAPAHLKGGYSDEVSRGIDTYDFRQPLGVVATITPFNFPVMAPMNLFAFALVCGNAVVHKPSPRTPSASVILAEIAQDAGIPDGVLNVVHGDKRTVDVILDHPGIASASFIGSSPVARYVYTRGTSSGKRVQAFGGAKNHMVVMPDADMELASEAAVAGGFGASGQRCMAVSVIVAVGDAGDRLVECLRERAAAVKVGPASDPAREMGPLISGAARSRILDAVGAAESQGATVVVDGRERSSNGSAHFLAPTVVDGVSSEMEMYRSELFGPVLSVVRVDSLDDAIRLASESPFGNGASIFTDSGAAARRFSREVQIGMIGINVPIPLPVFTHSFGGWKQSMFGDQHMGGPEGFRFFTRAKVVTERWNQRSDHGLAFPVPR